MINKLVFLSLFLLVLGCEVSSKTEIDNATLTAIFSSIEEAFNNADYEKIMEYYHPDYLHNNTAYYEVENFWFSKIIDFDNVKITSSDFGIDDDIAIPYFTIEFITVNNTEYYSEKDFQYFGPLKKITQWRFYGNQLSR